MSRVNWRIRCSLPALLLVVGFVGRCPAQQPAESATQPGHSPVRGLVGRYCLDCHSDQEKTAGLSLESIDAGNVSRHSNQWEKVLRKLRVRQMPPAGSARPEVADYEVAVESLEKALDRAAADAPNPGRTPTLRRLTRTEYQNAVRDLLSLEIDVADLLPADDSGHGFDTQSVSELSPTLLDRYLTAAERISRLAIGSSANSPGGDTLRVKADITQEEHVPGLPLGTRGGALFRYHFPQDGQYDIQVRLARDRNEEVEGLREPHELEILIDRRREAMFTITPPAKDGSHQTVDQHLKARVSVSAGPHDLGVTFLKDPSSLLETRRQPYQSHFNMHRHPRLSPAVYQVSITGPYDAEGPGDTPSRRRIFVCRPDKPEEEVTCARQILATLMRRAYRRPVTDDDLARPLNLFAQARAEGDFDAGIELALSAILVSPHFLLRIEREQAGVAAGTVVRVSDLDLAARLSFFLWSSIPDDELLDLAERGELNRREVLVAQVRRMLKDSRSQSLVANFAGQWLHLRNLDATTPDLRLFPDFDENLRQALRGETERLVASILRDNRSVLDLLKSDATYLNERLAKHYEIPHVYGSRFRRVPLEEDSHRGGLLRQGSILTVTSYATRTSPVLRGKWVLENLLGTPPPPPLPNVPALKDNTVSSTLSVRQRLTEHRANAACASCHELMDPIGFSLENFDAVGRWRTSEDSLPIDASGGLPDGSMFTGIAGLEQALLSRPEVFVGTLTEKLLAYALGREIEPCDGPAIRKILRDAKANNYRFSSLVEGIAQSVPFQMRKSP